MYTINQLPDPFPPTPPGPRVKKNQETNKNQESPLKKILRPKKSMGGRNKTMTTDEITKIHSKRDNHPFQVL